MILVTGAGGHIGNVLVAALHKQGQEKLRLFVLPGEDIAHVKVYASEVVRGDIRDKEAVSKAVEGCDTVFHLAGIVTVSNRHKERVMDINYGGTKNVVQACIAHGARRLVYVSSTDSLKRSKDGRIDETLEPDIEKLKSVYGKTKAMANALVTRAAREGLDAVIVYPSAIIGPYDYRASLSGNMVRRYLTPGKTQFYFDGTYDFVDVRDAVNGMLKAWREGKPGQGYILSGNVCSIEEIIGAVQASTGEKISKMRIPTFLVYAAAVLAPIFSLVTGKQPIMSKNAIDVLTSNTTISSEKAANVLGYAPRELQSTIDDYVAWIRAGEQDAEMGDKQNEVF
jgi:dihydroflavonol-4-reductase